MDQLEILKKDWQQREEHYPKVSYNDIYKMLLKKSSSAVKWIFYISIGEIALWTLLYFLLPESSKQFQIEMGLKKVGLIVNIINYTVIIYFIYLFYKNQQKIKTTSSVKELMSNILKTRKTVHYFVYYNLGMGTLLLLAANFYYFINKEKLTAVLAAHQEYSAIPANTFILANVIAGVIIIGLLALFYVLIYGILLKRLKKNYRELKRIEV